MNRGANKRRTERRRAHGAEEVSTAGRLSPCKHAAVSPAPKRTHDDLPRKVLSGRDSRSPLFTSPWNTQHLSACGSAHAPCAREQHGGGGGARAPGRAAGRAGCAALRCAELRGKQRGLQAGLDAGEDRLRRALTARAVPARPLVRGGPIRGRDSHCKGAWPQLPGPPPKLWGRAWPQVQSELVAALRHGPGARLPAGHHPRVPGAARKRRWNADSRLSPSPHPSRPGMCRGNRFPFFKMAWVISTVCGFRRHAPASLHLHRDLTGQVSLSPA